MTKEQMIFKNIKHRVYKSHGKWGITAWSLTRAIREAGYDIYEANEIKERMVKNGYIRLSKTQFNKGLYYIIEKWVN